MFKKLVLFTVVALSALSLAVQAGNASDITLLVMPQEEIPLQIAQDISRRYPVLLVSYKLVRGELKLHAWNDETWVSVSAQDYANGTFFANRPKSAIIVEHEKFHAPAVLTPNSIWCESANLLSSTDPRVMLHLLGLHFDFPFSYWNQFAKRYNYSLEEINPAMNNVHWWNLRGDLFVGKLGRRDLLIDLDKWHDLETLPPPPIKPVVTEQPQSVPEVEIPASESVKVIKVNAPAKTPDVRPALEKAPAPAPSVKPVADIKPLPPLKPVTIVEPISTTEPAPAPLIEKPAAPSVETEKTMEATPVVSPDTAVEVDPFSTEEIPAAEIVVPQEPKKPGWKIF